MFKAMCVLVVSFPFLALAQVSTDSTVVETVTNIGDKIPTSLSAMVLLGIGVICELVMRLWPTKKPKSFLIMISSLLKGIGTICAKVSVLLDQVIQNLKPDVDAPK